jgi:hypothetical protein
MKTTTPHRIARSVIRLLAMAAVALAAAGGQPAPTHAQSGGPFGDDPEVAAYRMTQDDLTGFLRATENLKALDERDTFDLSGHLARADTGALNVEGMTAAFESEPHVRAAIEDAGMSPRRYVVFMFALIRAVVGAALASVAGEEALADMPDTTLKHNIRFFLDNEAAFAAMEN